MTRGQLALALVMGLLVGCLAAALSLMPISGTDDLAANAVLRVTPGYEPWSSHIYQPGGIYAAIFMGFQSGLGMFVGCLFVMWIRNRKVQRDRDADSAFPRD